MPDPSTVATPEQQSLLDAWDRGLTAEEEDRWCRPDDSGHYRHLTRHATRMLLDGWSAVDIRRTRMRARLRGDL